MAENVTIEGLDEPLHEILNENHLPIKATTNKMRSPSYFPFVERC
jgi:hypothetical protein